MRKLGFLIATSGLALAAGIGAANAAVSFVSLSLNTPFGTGFQTVVTFDTLAVGTLTPFSVGPVNFAGTGIVVMGNKGGFYAQPANDPTHYLATTGKKGGTETITFAGGRSSNKFGLYIGSPDAYNNISFFSKGTLEGSFVPTTSFGMKTTQSGFASFAGTYDRVVLSTTSANFEVDNISVGTIPEPSTWAMMLIGFGGLGFAAYFKGRRKDNVGVAMMAA